MISSITSRQLTNQDHDFAQEGLALLNRTQGQGLFGPNYLKSRLNDADSFVVAAFKTKELVGLASVQLMNKFDYYLPFDPNIVRDLENKLVAAFNTSAVIEPLQGKGIGRLLMEKRLEWVRNRNCDVAIGVSWISGLAHTSLRTFEGAGFRAVRTVEDFYRKISLENPFDCPGCRQHPCGCAAILYRRDFLRVSTIPNSSFPS
jgi:GNAT superfamily N-acetyltransferase